MSGDEMFRPRARVIREPQRPRARVVESDLFTPMFEGPRIIGVQEFIEEFRRSIGLAPGKPLGSADFWEVAEKYPELLPVVIYNPGNHWVLVRELTDTAEVYDPTMGLREISESLRETSLYHILRDGNVTGINHSAERIRRSGFSLPREPLARLGGIQRDPLNCGPLVIYAALVAKGHIKSS